MRLTWNQRIQYHPELKSIDNWPKVNPGILSKAKRKHFLRNLSIISAVLGGQQAKDVAQRFQLSKSSVSNLMNRALGGFEEETPALTLACIPHQRIKTSCRVSELPTISKPKGSRCAFQHLLISVPGLKKGLDNMIRSYVRDRRDSQNLTPKLVFGEFKRLLSLAQWPTTKYPYTSTSLGYESVRKYFNEKVIEFRLDQIPMPNIGDFKTFPKRYFDEIQIDEQLMDINVSIEIEIQNTRFTLRVSRLSIIVAVDVGTDAILGYHIAYTPSPNQEDLLEFISNLTQVWKPMKLKTPGFSYAPGSCMLGILPSQTSPVTFGTIKLDNALVHWSESVKKVFTLQFASTVNLGLPKTPKSRNWIERVFRMLNQTNHRFNSTTGSHVDDPVGESSKNKKLPPKLNFRTLQEAISIVLSEHNVLPQERLGNKSPVDLAKEQYINQYMPISPPDNNRLWSPLLATGTAKIKLLKNENRAPFINFAYLRYSGKCLHNSELIGKRITFEYFRNDIRKLKVFDSGGIYVGDVFAPKSWRGSPISLHTRIRIHKIQKQEKFKHNDCLAGYFDYLLHTKTNPKSALEILRVIKSCSQDGETLFLNDLEKDSSFHDDEPQVDDSTCSKKSANKFNWNSNSANALSIEDES